jgi:23S rRNA pseudouridine1911/1915/1917 synthase
VTVRLDVFLAEQLGSRSAAQKAINEGRVTVDGVVRQKRYAVDGTEVIEVNRAPSVPETDIDPARFAIAWEDEDVLVVDKPAGVIVHPGSAVAGGTLVQALAGKVAGGDDLTRPGVVHRLDKDTSGLLLFTRNGRSWTEMARQIKAREVEREYLALVKGRPKARAGTIEAPLGRDRRNRTLRSSDTDDPRDAVTHFEQLETFPEATLLKVTLETGRTHQIRAHLKAIGHPVFGDPEYGVPHQGLGRQFLHAHRLAFVHPVSGQRIEVRSELPDDLDATLNQFRNPTLRP